MKILPMGLIDGLNILFFFLERADSACEKYRNIVLFMLVFLVEESDCMQRCLDEGTAKDHPSSASVL